MSGIYNIGSGKGTSVHELARTALDIVGQSQRSVISLAASPQPSFNVLDATKIHRLHGWKSTKNVYQCIKDLINFKQLY